jgi:hypothetical protein
MRNVLARTPVIERSLPEINEKRFIYRRRVFPLLPIRPSFTKIARITAP